MIRPDGYFAVPTRAIAVEQTHNRAGGGVIPLATLRELRAVADDAGVALHCDGARIWHAHVADGVPLAEYGALFDTLSVCLSKGLGAPVGSLVRRQRGADRARPGAIRKRMGGGMRQAGILAAAGRYALAHHIDRLADDHARARPAGRGVRAVRCGRRRPGTDQHRPAGPDEASARRVGRSPRPQQGVLVSVLAPHSPAWSPTSTSTTRSRPGDRGADPILSG